MCSSQLKKQMDMVLDAADPDNNCTESSGCAAKVIVNSFNDIGLQKGGSILGAKYDVHVEA